MPRDTLVDFFADFAALDGPFVVHDDGYRSRTATYREVADAARRFADQLAHDGIVTGDAIVIWSENSIEWLVVFWGAVLAGVVVVPVDYRSSAEHTNKIAGIVRAKAIFAGEEVAPPSESAAPIVRLRDLPSQVATSTKHQAPSTHPGSPSTKHAAPSTQHSRSSGSLAEVLFTSGATADPKGVTITHKNLLANIVPLEREVKKYRKYMWPFDPIRFLNLLPMSHMFGQSMATFVPPMIEGTVVFTHGYNPAEIVRQIKSRRISVLVCVPKVLEMLAAHVRQIAPSATGPEPPAGAHWSRRWWHHRDAHRLFGWKFWCVVVGAAPLDPELERFWRRLGFVVVQGYGLTETAPIVTLNHPLRPSMGSVGRPIAGVDVRIADDGEILVRGDNVSSGYFRDPSGPPDAAPASPPAQQDDGWFHTGDIGEVDATGRLTIKGRKKEMIVTADGLKVFPEDVERMINAQSGVRESAVVGVRSGSDERVHAVIVADPDADLQVIMRSANARLEDHQRIRSISRWPGDALPRTDGTRKLKRREIQRWVSGDAAGGSTTAAVTVEAVLSRFTPIADLTPDTTLNELGLSSLTQIEVMMALEEAFQVTLAEASFATAKTIADIRRLVGGDTRQDLAGVGGGLPPEHWGRQPSAPSAGLKPRGYVSRATRSMIPGPAITFPRWARSRPVRLFRRLSLPTWVLPLTRPWVRLTVDGLEQLAGIRGPVVFASNHQSLMDVPVILRALPSRLRYRVATAMAKEMFAPVLLGRSVDRRSWGNLGYTLACLFFNAFPLPQREAGARETMRYIGEIVEDDDSVLIFPEGKRTEHGEIGTFKPGVGMIASRLDLPVVPVRIEGLDRVLHTGWRWAVRGPVRVSFGAPITISGDDYASSAHSVEDAVRRL